MSTILNFLRRFSIFDYYPVALALFIIGLVVQNKFNISHFITLPGLLLLAYLPGYHFIRLIRLPIGHWYWYGRLALYFATSIVIIALAQFVGKAFVPFTAPSQIALLLLVNTGLYILVKCFAISSNTVPNVFQRLVTLARSSTKTDYLILLLPLLLYGFTLLINPTVDNADSYLEMYQKAVETQTYPQEAIRIFFIPLLAIYSYATHFAPATIFKLILTLSFYSSLFMAFDYIKRTIANTHLGWLTYLLVLAPPVVVIEANIVRPQLLVMAFTVPILLLLVEAIKNRSYPFAGLALWFSFMVSGFHELGAIFIAICGLAIASMLWGDIFIRKELKLTLKQILLGIIIIFPYTQLFPIADFFAPIARMIAYAIGFIDKINWQWWFIDSYTTIDGFNVGWPGIQALHYYLYNGLLVLALMLPLSLLLLWKGRVSKAEKHRSWIILIPLSYVAIYFAFAELLPRIGLFFIPNRAWPHLMLGLLVCLMLFIENNQDFLAKKVRLLAPLFVLAILPGIFGTLYLTQNRIGNVFPEELAAAQFIQSNTPENSLFISTQNNTDLVRLYAKRNFQVVTEDQYARPVTDMQLFQLNNRLFHQMMTTPADPYDLPEQSIITKRYTGDQLIDEVRTIISPASHVVPQPPINARTPIYFVYSLRKVSGLNAQRAYNKKPVDVDSAPFFSTLKGKNVIYRDKATVVVQIAP